MMEVAYMRRWSCEANKFRCIDTIRGRPREIDIKEREIYYIYQNQNLPVYHILLLIDKFKPKEVASVSEEFALLS